MRNRVNWDLMHPISRVFCLTLLGCVTEFTFHNVQLREAPTLNLHRALCGVRLKYTWGKKRHITLLHCAIFFIYYNNQQLCIENIEEQSRGTLLVCLVLSVCLQTHRKKTASRQTETFQPCLTWEADILLMRLLNGAQRQPELWQSHLKMLRLSYFQRRKTHAVFDGPCQRWHELNISLHRYLE